MAESLLLNDPDTVTLSVGGQFFSGWTGIEIRQSLDSLCGSFNLRLADRGPEDRRAFPFEAGAACEVRVGNELLITGFIDQLSPAFDDKGHDIVAIGRDRAADLIDCSAIHKPGSWTKVSLEVIANDLAKPFGVKITASASTAPVIKKFAIEQGETVYAAIERLCRFRGLLMVATPSGDIDLIAVKPGEAVEKLAFGVNILRANATHDVSNRFSDYVVKGQAQGSDEANGRTVSAIKGTATDPAIKRHRPLLILSEDQSDRGGLETRAKWEATTRAGRSQSATITVPGWRTPAGKLRARGMIFDVNAPWLFMDGKMLATEVALRVGEDGKVTEITLSPPSAYSQLAIPETAKASRVRDRSA